MQRSYKTCRAFTLIELLIVLTILGILAAVAIPTVSAPDLARLKSAAMVLAADIEFAQAEAIATGRPCRVEFVGGNRYQIVDPSGGGTPVVVRRPQNDSPAHAGFYVVDLDDPSPIRGVRIASAAFGRRALVEFSSFGAPNSGGQVTLQFGRHAVELRVATITGIVTIGERMAYSEP